MASWDLYIADKNGEVLEQVTSATGRKFVWELDKAPVVEFETVEPITQAAALVTDIVAWRDRKRIFCGRITPSQISKSPGDIERAKFSAVGYQAILDRTPWWPTSRWVWTSTEQTQIVSALIYDAQYLPGANWNVDLSDLSVPTGVGRDFIVEPAKSVGDMIRDLSNMPLGFEFEIDADNVARCWFPRRGVDTQWLAYPGHTVMGYTVTDDSQDYATDFVGYGKGVGPVGKSRTPRPYGRWTAAEKFDAESSGALETETQRALDKSAWLTAYEIDVDPLSWSPANCWVGDDIRLTIKGSMRSVDETVRIQRISIDLDDSGLETIKFNLAKPLPTLALTLTDFRRRIAELERRA